MKRRERLSRLEMLTTLLLLAVVLIAIAVSLAPGGPAVDEGSIPSSVRRVTVNVTGAVQRPGTYLVDSGRPLQDVLDSAIPLGGADLSALTLQSKLRSSKKLVIPERSTRQMEPLESLHLSIGKDLFESDCPLAISAPTELVQLLTGTAVQMAQTRTVGAFEPDADRRLCVTCSYLSNH